MILCTNLDHWPRHSFNSSRHYILSKEVSIDETMIGYKGLSFIQYMPKKPTKWGMKAYDVLADPNTGYIYNWYLYSGMHLSQEHTHVHVCTPMHTYSCIYMYTHINTFPTHVQMYTYALAGTHLHTRTWTHTHIHGYAAAHHTLMRAISQACTCAWVCGCVHACVCVYVHACMCMCICAWCMYMCVCMCMCCECVYASLHNTWRQYRMAFSSCWRW